ncbi:YfiR family protein [Paraburkholderia guartelaensis]|uniref:YfiR family protein n=1 Tax=Paraburkholderia guartelaensis TaxID=2546446 RepID=A0A4R5LMG3_9BURK|nr:YfiR family protein [Paraburkholderia guartelaensis]TDG11070.1 YfiR family protein [Paraburkholderia guartelaensis]
MDASVRASGACRATAMTPRCATEIIALATFGRPAWSALLRHVLLAVACALGAAPASHADAPARSVDPASTAYAVTGASRADSAISPRDAAVRQVVLGIISFTRWPTPPERLHLCVTGRPDYAQGLVDTLQAGSTPLEVQHVQFDDSTLGTTCQVVYLGELSASERQQVSAALAGHPVLTIAEHDPSCTAGSMFCLNVDVDRVTFDINLDAVARSGVRVHPNVLNLARRPVTP